jgi:D-alanyl-D-alanine dipeptidase
MSRLDRSIPRGALATVTAVLLAGCTGTEDSRPSDRAETTSATRLADGPPAEIRGAWSALIGEYAEGADTFSVLEEDGALVLLRWGGERRALDPAADGEFVARAIGSDGSVPVTVQRLGTRTSGISVGDRLFPRLSLGADDGATFRITPTRDPDELRSEALAASPPLEEGDFRPSDLVELVALDPTIALDVRYATTNNFMGEVFYSEPRAFLQRPAAEALVRAHEWLADRGYGLLIHDGYRPWYVTKMFWDATPEDLKIFVADPSSGSRHNRGCAVDLTLFDLKTGEPITMTGGYDEMSPRSFPEYPGGTDRQRWHRELLRSAMEMQGFDVYEAEWWHFDYEDWRSYRIANETFEELGA